MEERRILKSQKNVFWEAAIIAIFIFGLGILLGVFIENSRTAAISDLYLKSELDLLNIKIQTELIGLSNLNCPEAVKKNVEFGNQIFNEAKLLDDYEEASRVSNSLELQHKRYDLLRTLFWVNSIKIKEKCGDSFHTVVYLYNYKPKELNQESEQEVFSRFLTELKNEKGEKLVLIPIAKNMNLSSLDILLSNYKLGDTSIIVDEKMVVTDIKDFDRVRNAID